jgi:hypothetical protein
LAETAAGTSPLARTRITLQGPHGRGHHRVAMRPPSHYAALFSSVRAEVRPPRTVVCNWGVACEAGLLKGKASRASASADGDEDSRLVLGVARK